MNVRAASRRYSRRYSALRRTSVLVGLMAFVLQMVMWSVYAPAMAAGETTLICTVKGLKEVQLDSDGRPVTPEKAKASHDPCSFCMLAQGLAAAPAVFTASLPVSVARHGTEALPGAVIAAGWFLSTLQARAPPAFLG